MKEMYFTIAGCNHYYGSDFMEKGMKVKLVKEPDNEYDSEAIQVKIKGLGKVGYVANSPYTVKGESMSAGRLYDKIGGKANLDHCVGMAANMIGVKKNIIVVAAGPFQFAMINPVITGKSGAFQTEEGCLSLDGVRPCTRYKEIEVDYFDQNFKKKHGKYTGWTAQIIQHDECDIIGTS